MDKSLLFLGVTLLLLIVLGAIVARVYRRGHREDAERPKHRMLDDD